MADQQAAEATYHVLLIGVDNYPGHELQGCVNDIDAVQRVLLERLKIPPACIQRLASPLADTQHETAVAEQRATIANIRAALDALDSDRVKPGDRVFMYYSGHGKRVLVEGPDGPTFQREALVPVDFESPHGPEAFLFDFELNRRLAAIAARTSSVAVVLDCCHAGGATRGDEATRRDNVRTFERDRDQSPIADPARELEAAARDGLGGGVDSCHVVSACLANETCRELVSDGKPHGVLTSTFIAALRATERADLRTLTWDRIWYALRAEVAQRNPGQSPRMDGSTRRAVFGGPPVDGDAGLYVTRDGGGYRVAAGTITGVTTNTELAIYGPEPARFPPLDSTADLAVRLGVVRVTEAEPGTARAIAAGEVFELPAGARGRVVKAGAASRLCCAVTPPDAAIEAQLARSRILQLVGAELRPPVRLVRQGERWYLTDDEHGTGGAAPVLFAFDAGDAIDARAVLEHYYRYSAPLRVAARATDLPGGLDLRVLRCPDGSTLPAEEAQDPKLSEAPIQDGRYQVTAGAAICVAVRNRADEELQVALFDVSPTGQVQLLGDASVLPGRRHVFWARSTLGQAFKMRPVDGAVRSRDRFVAIARTALTHDLRYLRVQETFQQIAQLGQARPVDEGGDTPLERWTAAQVVIETIRP